MTAAAAAATLKQEPGPMMKLLQTLDIPTQGASIFASLGTALFGAVLQVENISMLVVLGFMMLLDLIAGLGKSFNRRQAGVDWFDEGKLLTGVVHKVLGMVLVFACGAIDGVAQHMPGLGEYVEGITPFTKLALGALLIGQFVSVLRNLLKAGVDAPVIKQILSKFGVSSEESREIEAVKPPTPGKDVQ